MGNAVRIRWDRVCILLAGLTVLIVVAGHAIVRGVTAGQSTSDEAPAAAPVAPAAAPVAPAAAPVAKPCPAASVGELRTAPHEAGQRTVALTFDDGPGEWTDDVLAVLAQEDVKATFFVV